MIILAILLQTSTCTTFGNTTNCAYQPGIQPAPIITQTAPPEIDGAAAYNLGVALRERKARGRRKAVGKFLAAGKCQEAETYALDKGELELAAYARSYCAAR